MGVEASKGGPVRKAKGRGVVKQQGTPSPKELGTILNNGERKATKP